MNDEELIKLSIEEFAERLASADPAPGGGGAGALAGALAAALGAMVGEITIANPGYASVSGELNEALISARSYMERLLECIDEDAAAFTPLSEVYSMAKDTPGYDELKEQALRDAAVVPMEILSLSAGLTDILRVFADKGSKMLISDAASGAALAKAAMETAYINVIVNTRLMKDRDFADSLSEEARALRDIYCAKAADIYNSVDIRLSPEAPASAEALRMSGAPAAKALTETLRGRVEALVRSGITPTLSILRVGEDPSDIAYENSIIRKAADIGIAVRHMTFSDGVEKARLLAGVEEINHDDSIHGCLIMRPMKDRTLEAAVAAALDPAKDIDAVTYGPAGGRGFAPCTAEAVIEILRHYGIETIGRKAVVIGRSFVIGRPVAMLLLGEDATVTICHSKSEDLREICRSADIIVAAVGRPGLIDETYLTPGQTLIDVGTSVGSDGTLRGDISEELKAKMAAAYTPVPGGVGAMTTTILLRHLAEAAEYGKNR